VSALNPGIEKVSNALCFPGGLRGPSNRDMFPMCGGGPLIEPLEAPGGMFNDPVLICLYSWWGGILLEGPALLSIALCTVSTSRDGGAVVVGWGVVLFCRMSVECRVGGLRNEEERSGNMRSESSSRADQTSWKGIVGVVWSEERREEKKVRRRQRCAEAK
jgi:hypothetical protein